MPLEPLLPLFHRLNREHFEGTLTRGHQPLLAVRWSDGRLRRTAGFYRRGPAIAPLLVGRSSCPSHCWIPAPGGHRKHACHEMIHAWVDLVLKRDEGHGPHFRERMAAINASQSRFEVSVRHRFPVPQTLRVGWLSVPPAVGGRPTAAGCDRRPAAPVAISTMGVAGTPVVCFATNRRRSRAEADGGFFLGAGVGGVSIVLIGLQRERWLQHRRR